MQHTNGQATTDHPSHTLRVADYDAHTFVPPTSRSMKKQGRRTATISVSYIGFSLEAQNAFQYAVEIWERHLTSPVTINVQAVWEALEPNVLGSAGPRTILANFSPRVPDGVWYPPALAEAIEEENLTDGDPDIVASFNSDFSNWYFGTDGITPTGQFDFVTVVLHELGHGLGFFGSFDVDDGIQNAEEGNFDECPGAGDGFGCWGFSTSSGLTFPMIFDTFAEDASENLLINEAVYPNPSQALGDVLVSNDVFFNSEAVRSVNIDFPADLYAPNNFEPGSSFSHLDEQVFAPGDPNSLMTPQLGRAEAIHSPGAITCAIFQDMGWPLGDECAALFGQGLLSFAVERRGDDIFIAWQLIAGSFVEEVIIEQKYLGEFQQVEVVDASSGDLAFSRLIEDVTPGRYTYRLRIVFADGSVATSAEEELFVPPTGNVFISEAFPNPFTNSLQFLVVPGARQTVVVAVYDATGRRTATFTEDFSPGQQRLLQLDAGQLGLTASGLYFVQIRGQQFLETRKIVYVK